MPHLDDAGASLLIDTPLAEAGVTPTAHDVVVPARGHDLLTSAPADGTIHLPAHAVAVVQEA